MRYLFILILFTSSIAHAQFSKELGLNIGLGHTTVTTDLGSNVQDGFVARFVYDAVFDKWDNIFYLTAGFRYSMSAPASSWAGIGGVVGLQHAFQIARETDFRYGINFGPIAEFGGGKVNVAAEFLANFLLKERISVGVIYQQPFTRYEAYDGAYYAGSKFIISNFMIEVKTRLRR
jgi:hypothetical protein